MKRFNKKEIICLVGLLLVLIVVGGVSYAYFTAGIGGNESESTISIRGGELKIEYSDNSSQTVFSNIFPSDEAVATKMFTITGNNTTDTDMFYTARLIVDENTFDNDVISYKITGTNTSENGSVFSVTENTPIATGVSTIVL